MSPAGVITGSMAGNNPAGSLVASLEAQSSTLEENCDSDVRKLPQFRQPPTNRGPRNSASQSP